MPSLAAVLAQVAIAASPDWRHCGTEVHDQHILGRKHSRVSTDDAMRNLVPGWSVTE